MPILENVLQAVGNTPLIKLSRMVDQKMGTVLGKAEFINPTGSIKDRMAVHMILKAEKEKKIKPGATIVEATAGNTGLAVAMVAAVKGYNCVFTVPDKMSLEKINMLKAYGAEVVVTPSDVTEDDPQSWRQVAKRIVEETPNSFYINQFFERENVNAHYLTTGPEIWEQTEGNIDFFVAGAGSGGTISGAGLYLKEQASKVGKDVKLICPDPSGSIYFDKFYGKESIKKSYKIEGIGNSFIPGCLDLNKLDQVRKVSDRDAFLIARKLARVEGLFVGSSAGANVAVALEIAKEVGPGKVIVAVLSDGGGRYMSRFFDDNWMKDFGFMDLESRFGTVQDILHFKGSKVEFANVDETLSQVISRMSKLGISQMPIPAHDGRPHLMIDEVDILQSLVSGKCKPEDLVREVAAPLQGQISLDTSISRLNKIFDENKVAVVIGHGDIVGIISKIDVVRYLSA